MAAKKIFYILSCIWIVMCILIFLLFVNESYIRVTKKELDKIIATKDIETILIDSDMAYFYTKDNIYQIPTNAAQIYNLNLNSHPILTTKVDIYSKILFIIMLCAAGVMFLYTILFKRNKINISKATTTKNTKTDIKATAINTMSLNIKAITSKIKFSDVAGINEVKDDLLELIDYLKNPKKYQELGIFLPKGVLLVGPPGVGKTMIAKAVAGESGVPFFYQSGSSFVEMYVGIGAQRVRELFAKARIHAPSIIFIDEIDSIGKMRGATNNQEWESTLNELLTQMDGFNEQTGVIVMGATNQVEVMDKALLRSGRFDRRIYVDLPNIEERREIIKTYLKNRKYNFDINEVSKLCVGFSGANIASLINEAAINALRNKRSAITMQDVLDTTDKIIFGKKRQQALSQSQKKILSLYNAGKAISQYWLLPDFQKISLINVTNQRIKTQNCSLRSELMSHIKVALSGNLTLKENGLEYSIIAKEDIEQAKQLAHEMCEKYGMGERLIPTQNNVLDILEEALREHRDFIVLNQKSIQIASEILLEKERLHREEIHKILQGLYN